MKNRFYLVVIFAFLACSQQEDIGQTVPLEIELRKTLAEIERVPAYLDVEEIANDNETNYIFSFELQDEAKAEILVPGMDSLICKLLTEELMYGMGISDNCALEGYYYRYLYPYPSPIKMDRMHVAISGKVKERHPNDLFTGSPLVLERIEKIESCPVAISDKSGSFSLENRFWNLVGFTDQNGKIISSPTCENPEIGITFYDRLLTGSPIEDPDAKTFRIESAAWIRPSQLFLVYGIESENRLSITRAVDPSWMPPRPATAPSDNFVSLTKDTYNKFDSLRQIFKFTEPVDFMISGNKLELHNPSNGIRALFVTD
jgi:hypothetical protein